MSNIKPCPFCGSSKTVLCLGDYDWMVECEDCTATGPFVDSEKEAIALWNKRSG